MKYSASLLLLLVANGISLVIIYRTKKYLRCYFKKPLQILARGGEVGGGGGGHYRPPC